MGYSDSRARRPFRWAWGLALGGLLAPARADGPYGNPGPPGPPPVYTTPNARRKPEIFQSPWDLYQRMKKDLGTESASEVPGEIPTENQLKKKSQALQDEYRACKDGKRKQELIKLIKETELDSELIKHMATVQDFALRRKLVITDVLDGLVALAVLNNAQEYRSIFKCGVEEIRKDFIRILKDLPGKEVAPYLYRRLEEQLRFGGQAGEQKLGELNAAKDDLKRQQSAVREQVKLAQDESRKAKLSGQEDELTLQLETLEGERLIVQAAVTGRNEKFIKLAEELLAGIGAPAVGAVIPGLYSTHTGIRLHAGAILRRIGAPAIGALIEALAKLPSEEAAALLTALTGKHLGTGAEAWSKWWASAPQNPEAGKGPASEARAKSKEKDAPGPTATPPAAPAPKPVQGEREDEPKAALRSGPTERPPESAADDECLRKLKEELKVLRGAAELVRKARARHAERILLSHALERQLQELEKKPAAEKESKTKEREGRLQDVREALKEALRQEYAARAEAEKKETELERVRQALLAANP